MRVLITGGCGFIGSAVVRHVIRSTDHSVINVDAMTYAASEDALEEARTSNRHELVRADIADGAAMREILATRQPDAVMHLAAELDRRIPDPAGPRSRLIQFVTDRPGHDFRYEIDPSRAEAALGWKAEHDFESGLAKTVDWYLNNRAWWEKIRAGRYQGQRLGTAA